MLAGMGTVFAFLTTLVIVTTLMSKLVSHFESSGTSGEATDEEVAAITVAVARHRNK